MAEGSRVDSKTSSMKPLTDPLKARWPAFRHGNCYFFSLVYNRESADVARQHPTNSNSSDDKSNAVSALVFAAHVEKKMFMRLYLATATTVVQIELQRNE